MSDLVWIDVEAYWNAESDQGNVITGKYSQGVKAGETYDAIIIFSGGFWISKFSNLRYRQGIAERFVKRNEAVILKTARALMNKNIRLKEFEIGKLRRVGIQNTGISSNRSPSGIKYYPASRKPMVMLQFEGTFLSSPVQYSQILDKRPRAEVL